MKQVTKYSVIIFLIILVASCRKREVPMADIFANFETTALGITPAESEVSFKIRLTSSVRENVNIVVNMSNQNVLATEYSITPQASAAKLNIVIPAGNNEATITIKKVTGSLYDGDEKVQLTLEAINGAGVLVGATKQITISFAELVSTAASATINGGGINYPNRVFIDLSSNRQYAVTRTNWDLGFFTAPNEYRVILNSASAMMARQINKNDLLAVTATDTIGFSNEVAFNQTNPSTASLPYIDYPNGDITRTAIAAISATASNNKVYIVNRGLGIGIPTPSRGWKKIRIIQNGNGYSLQYADIAATTFSTINITKNDDYYFNYISFDAGATVVEPIKKKWDLAWSYFSNVTNFGNGEVPYLFQDVMLQNRNVQAVQVLEATKPFVAFSEVDIATLAFQTAQNAIGSSWRSGGGPTTAPAVRTDRYYIVKDGDNNVYKLRFTALTQNGERGYPAYEAILVKKG